MTDTPITPAAPAALAGMPDRFYSDDLRHDVDDALGAFATVARLHRVVVTLTITPFDDEVPA